MGPGVNEILLVDEGGHILEGTQTNFFAVLEGRVHTAGEGILGQSPPRRTASLHVVYMHHNKSTTPGPTERGGTKKEPHRFLTL